MIPNGPGACPRVGPEQGDFMIADSFGRYPVETAHDHETGPAHGL